MDALTTLQLRIRPRRFLGGFRREDVEVLLAQLGEAERQLRAELDAGREREIQLRTAQAEVAALRAREGQLNEALIAAQRRAVEIEESANARAAMILAQAEEKASKVRGDAYLKIDDIGRQLDDIIKLRATMLEGLRTVARETHAAVGRIERGEVAAGTEPPVTSHAVSAQPSPVPQPAAPQASLPAPTAEPSVAPTPSSASDSLLFDRRIEIEAGPFGDFAALSVFERSLAKLPSVEDVYVRRFYDTRATVELSLSHESQLIADLRSALPYPFEVGHAEASKLAITVHATALAAL